MGNRFRTGLVALAVWLLLAWPVDPRTGALDTGSLVAGLVVALLVGATAPVLPSAHLRPWLEPRRYLWALVYAGVFVWEVVLANLDVAYRVLHPRLPIRPGIVKVPTELRSTAARVVLANSITLTPGTLTVEIQDDGVLYVHWLNVRATDPEGARTGILRRFERILARVFE